MKSTYDYQINIDREELSKDHNLKEALIELARYMYTKTSTPILKDIEYDILVQGTPYEGLTYEDEILTERARELGEKYGINFGELDTLSSEIQPTLDVRNKMDLMNYFNKNLSITMIREDSEIDKFLNSLRENKETKELHVSMKFDGWNITAYYLPNTQPTGVYFAHTRGKASTAQITDCTNLLELHTPKLKTDYLIKVVGELIVTKPNLEKLRESFPEKHISNVRNCVSSFVNKTLPEKYNNLVTFVAFSYELYDTVKNCPIPAQYSNRNEMIKQLKEFGFTTPEETKGLSGVISLDNSNETIINIIKKIGNDYAKRIKPIIECDGLVLASNQFVSKGIIGNNLNVQNGLAAYKGSVWSENYYVAEIEEFYFNYNNKELPLMAKVKSIKTDFGSIIDNVPLYNPSKVYYDKLDIGSKIIIEYFSNQIVKYIGPYKEKK